MRIHRLSLVALAAALSLLAPAASAATAPLPTATVAVQVTPPVGNPKTTFVISYRARRHIGDNGSTKVYDQISTSVTPAPASHCQSGFYTSAPKTAAGARVQVLVSPYSHWCLGTYRGRITETQTVDCHRREFACPRYILVPRVIGSFELRVAPTPAGLVSPVFAGLQKAFACTPGPQRPGQTTPFTLSWTAAAAGNTPDSQLVYDIYYATVSGHENYTQPNWTSKPGVTSFRTPGLASHGSFYFVVRARDRAGGEDSNTVERRGVDPCE